MRELEENHIHKEKSIEKLEFSYNSVNYDFYF